MQHRNHLKNVQMLLLARLFAKLGDNILRFVLPLLAYQQTSSVTYAALAFCCQWGPRVLLLPIVGTAVDHLGSRRSYLWFEGTRALALTVGSVALLVWAMPAIGVVCMVSAVTSLGGAVVFIALEKALAERLAPGERTGAQSIIQVIEQGTTVASPLIGGVVTTWLSPAEVLALASAVFVVSMMSAFLDRGVETSSSDSVQPRMAIRFVGIWRDLRDGWRFIMEGAALRKIVVLSATLNFVSGVVMATLAAVVTGAMQLPAADFGVGNAMAGGASILAVSLLPLFFNDQDMPVVLSIGSLVVCVTGIGLGLAREPWLYFGFYGLLLAGAGMFSVALRILRSKFIPPNEMGRCLSIMMLLNQLPIALSGVMVSSLGSFMAAQHIILGTALLSILLLIGMRSWCLNAQAA